MEMVDFILQRAIDIEDLDLTTIDNIHRYKILCTFVAKIRRSRFCQGSNKFLKKESVRKIIEDVGETF